MKKPCLLTVTVLFLCGVFFASLLFSCSSGTYDASFISQLDEVDSYIRLGDTEEAFSLLKKAEKKADTPYAKLGIYKRYKLLGEDAKCEKLIKKAVKQFPENLELTAVYSNYLMRHGRTNEALELSRKLSGTPYSSFYAEAVLCAVEERGEDCLSVFVPKKKYKPKKINPEDSAKIEESHRKAEYAKKAIYQNAKMSEVYEDAWRSSKLGMWLRNSASMKMKNGNFDEAVSLLPEAAVSYEDSLFWGIVCYDAAYYVESLNYLLQAKPPLKKENDFDIKFEYLEEEISALAGDDYYILGEEDASEAERQFVIESVKQKVPVYAKEALPAVLERIVPPVYINSANYAALHNEIASEYEILSQLIDIFPEYTPGLCAYSRMALENYFTPEEENIVKELRASGLRTIEMEKKDALPKVTVEEAVNRIKNQLENLSDPELVVLNEQFYNALNPDLTKEEKVARIWTLLETHLTGKNLYPSELMHYAVAELLSLGDVTDAKVLFEKYIEAQYGNGLKEKFSPSAEPGLLKLWEIEAAAWFAADRISAIESSRLYTYILEKYSSRTPALITGGEQNAVINSFLNLAEIKVQNGNEKEALDLLNKAAGRTVDAIKKAEIIYRMAKINISQGDSNSALLSLKYALKLNPEHNNAQILLNRLK